MLALAIRYWQIGLGGLVGAIVAFGLHSLYVTAVSLPAARQEGRAAILTEQAEAAADAERERRADDATLRGMSSFDLCASDLRRRGLPVDACTQLLGLDEERPEPGRDGRADPG